MKDSSTDGQRKDTLKLDFDSLPLEGFTENRIDVQRNFDAYFARLTLSQQAVVTELLTKKKHTKKEIEEIQKMFALFHHLQFNPINDEVMEE